MKKRIQTIAAIVLAIALLCICTLPLKTEINLSLPGGRIDFEGNVMSEETAVITGCYRNYLLRKDTLELNVDFPGLTTRTNSVKPDRFENWPEESFIRQNHGVYVGEWERAGFVSVYLAKDGSWYLVRIENRLFYGSAESGPTPADIIAITGMTH